MPFKDINKRRAWQREYFKKRYHAEWKHNKDYIEKRNEKARKYQRELRQNHPEKKKLSNDRYIAKHREELNVRYYKKRVKVLKDKIKVLKSKLKLLIKLTCKR